MLYGYVKEKDVLVQQFSKDVLKERNFDKVLQNFIVIDIVEKNDKVFDSCNASRFGENLFYVLLIVVS